MKVGEIMTPNAISVREDAAVREVAGVLDRHRISGVPVCDPNGHMVGLITEYDLIATRLAMNLVIAEWRAARHPENRAYILKNHPAAVAGLVQLSGIARAQAQARVRRASGLDN